MIFWASSEADSKAHLNLNAVRLSVEPYINEAAAISELSSLEIKIRYIPIVMGSEFLSRYPARSKIRKKQKLYDCAPQLPHQPFVDGSWAEQVATYLQGLNECADPLLKMGATEVQVSIFKEILGRALIDLTAEKQK